jgi:hypothetical protein
MRAKGIGYDTGFEVGGRFNRPFEPERTCPGSRRRRSPRWPVATAEQRASSDELSANYPSGAGGVDRKRAPF